MSIRWLFFDVGWTLVDETKAHIQRFELARKFSPRPDRYFSAELLKLYEEAAAGFIEDPFAAVLEKLGLSAADRVRFPYPKELEIPYPDTMPALRELSGIYRLGLLANQKAGLAERCERMGWIPYMSVIMGSGDTGLSKPDPRVFAAAAVQAKCEPAEIAMIGDRLDNDIGPANAAGWRTIRILRGPHRRQTPRNRQEEPEFTIKSLAEIPGICEGAKRDEGGGSGS